MVSVLDAPAVSEVSDGRHCEMVEKTGRPRDVVLLLLVLPAAYRRPPLR